MYKPTFQKRSVLKFKHFSNHGYSLFSVLGKEVLIGVLSVATLQNATAKGISIETEKAETDSTITTRGIMMEEVNVTLIVNFQYVSLNLVWCTVMKLVEQ